VIDDIQKLIVKAEAVNDTRDLNQFARQIKQAHATVKKSATIALQMLDMPIPMNLTKSMRRACRSLFLLNESQCTLGQSRSANRNSAITKTMIAIIAPRVSAYNWRASIRRPGTNIT